MQRSDLLINIRGKYGCTPLHYVCFFQCDTIVEILLQHPDVDVNAIDDSNETPLHKTLTSSYISDSSIYVRIIQKLLEHSFILIDQKNNDDKTPLDLMKDRVNRILENKNERTSLQNDEVSCFTKIIHLFDEFPIKKRWQAYCYHVKLIDL